MTPDEVLQMELDAAWEAYEAKCRELAEAKETIEVLQRRIKEIQAGG